MPIEIMSPFFTDAFLCLEYSPENNGEVRPLPYESPIYFNVGGSQDDYQQAKNQILTLIKSIQDINADGLSFLQGYQNNINDHLDGLFHDPEHHDEIELALSVAKKKLEILYSNHSEPLARCDASLFNDLTVTACFPGATSNILLFFYRVTSTSFENKLLLAKRTALMNISCEYLKTESGEHYASISEIHRVNAYFNFAAPFFSLDQVEDEENYSSLSDEAGEWFVTYLNQRPLLLLQSLLDELLSQHSELDLPSENMSETYGRYIGFFGNVNQTEGFFSELPSILHGIYHDIEDGNAHQRASISFQERQQLSRFLLIRSLIQLGYLSSNCVQQKDSYVLTPEGSHHVTERQWCGMDLPLTRAMTRLTDSQIDFGFEGSESSVHLACFPQAEICGANAPELQKLQALLKKEEALTLESAHWVKSNFTSASSMEKKGLLLQLAQYGGWERYKDAQLLSEFDSFYFTKLKLNSQGNFIKAAFFYAFPDVISGVIDHLVTHRELSVSGLPYLHSAMKSCLSTGETLFERALRKIALQDIIALLSKKACADFVKQEFQDGKDTLIGILLEKLNITVGAFSYVNALSLLKSMPWVLTACAKKAKKEYDALFERKRLGDDVSDELLKSARELPCLLLGFGDGMCTLDSLSRSKIIEHLLKENEFLLLGVLISMSKIKINSEIKTTLIYRKHGKTLLQMAIHENNLPAVQFLLSYDTLSVSKKELRLAVKEAGVLLVETLFNHYVFSSEQEKKTFALLMIKRSVSRGTCDERVLSFLLNNADINAHDHEGETLLTWAVKKGKLALVNTLLQQEDLDVYKKSTRGENPVYLAVRGSHPRILSSFLKKKGVCLEESRVYKDSIFEAIALSGRISSLNILRAHRVFSDEVWQSHSESMVLTLLSHPSTPVALFNRLLDLNCLDLSTLGRVIGSWAAQWIKGEGTIPESVLQRLANKGRTSLKLDEGSDEEGNSLMSLAVERNHLAALQWLTQFDDITLRSPDRYGACVLDSVLRKETREEVAVYLLGKYTQEFKGWELEDGSTLLAVAISQNKWAFVEQLVLYKMDLFACDHSAHELYEYARKKPIEMRSSELSEFMQVYS